MTPDHSARAAVLALGLLAIMVVLLAGGAATARAWGVVRVEVRVWQHVEDGRDIRVGARPADGSWRTLGMIPMPLNDGVSRSGRYRYGDIAIDMPWRAGASPVTVEVRVWQHVEDERNLHISARSAGGSWSALGTIPLALDDSPSRTRHRFGDITIEVPLPPGEVATLAGWAGDYGNDDDVGLHARFGGAIDYLRGQNMGLAVDRDGNVVVADQWNHAIRSIAQDGTVTTVAGGIGWGFSDGDAARSRFSEPLDVAVDAGGNVYVADYRNSRIRKITPDRLVTTVAGPGEDFPIDSIDGIAVDLDGDLFIIHNGTRISRLSPAGHLVTFAGRQRVAGQVDGPREGALFRSLAAIDVDDAGNVYVLERNRRWLGVPGESDSSVRVIEASGSVRTLLQSAHPSVGGVLAFPSGLAVNGDGSSIYIANTGRDQIVELTRDGEVRAFAGSGVGGYADGARDKAQFRMPGALALTDDGTLLVVDQEGSLVRLVSPGVEQSVPLARPADTPRLEDVRVSVFAGDRPQRFADGPGNFLGAGGMAMDRAGNVIVADSGHHRIRRIAPDGTITTIAGGNGEGVSDGPCDEAQFAWPADIAVDADSSIYVAESSGGVRRITLAPTCTVTTVAGGGAADAGFAYPVSLTLDGGGSLLVAHVNLRILSPDGVVTALQGSGCGHGGITAAGGSAYCFALVDRRHVAIQEIAANGDVSTLFQDDAGIYGGVLESAPDLAAAPDGTLYAVDSGLQRVVRIDRAGSVAIVADRDDFGEPVQLRGIAVAADGDLLVSSFFRVWRVEFESPGGAPPHSGETTK